MSTSYGATKELLQCITTIVISHWELCIKDSNVSMLKSSRLSQKFLGSPGLCTKFDCRSRGTTTVLSMSSSSRDEIAKDNTDGLTYKDAGVHIDAGSELVRRMTKMTPGIGGFRE